MQRCESPGVDSAQLYHRSVWTRDTRVFVKIALLTTDSREHYKEYHRDKPFFGAAPEALITGFARLADLEVHVISCLQHPVSSPEKIAPNVWYHGLHVPKWGWLRTGYQGCIFAVRRMVRRIQPDLVHGQGTERDCALTAVLSGAPNVITIHGNMAELARLFRARVGTYNWFAARIENFALRRTAGVFCNSRYTEDLVRPRAVRTWRVPNAVRHEFFDLPFAFQRAERATLLNIGVVSVRKRQVELLEVIGKLHREGVPLHMQFIGQADPRDRYVQEFLQRIDVATKEGYASYLGLLPTRELIRRFDEAHALVHFPSEEAFGLAVPEALARNLHLFASAVGGIVDIVAGVPDAHLFAVNDWTALKEAIRRWVKEGFARSTSGREHMLARYDPQLIAQKHYEIYRELLSRVR